MNLAALNVVNSFNEIFLAYGQSDEFSFAFKRETKIYNRRAEKILTCILYIYLDIVSCFTSAYVFNWNKIFEGVELKFPPQFDGRIILYPSFENLKDYFSWRQVDCHINNLYNTTFWALVLMGKLTCEEAHSRLKGTYSKDKNEILYNQFGINYNFIEEIYKRGTLIFRLKEDKKPKPNEISLEPLNLNLVSNLNKDDYINTTDKLLLSDESYKKLLSLFYEKNIFITHEDVIQLIFWEKYNLTKY
jgi:tRNA(His) guanylyltransferase